jgi:undecaprenyl-diphosphatase
MQTTPAAADPSAGALVHPTPARSSRVEETLLAPRPGGLADRFAAALPGRSPVLVFLAALAVGYAVILALMIGFGLLIIDVLLPVLGGGDEQLSHVLAANRTDTLNGLSRIASQIGDMPAIPAVVIVVCFACLVGRRYRIAAFFAAAILVEAATYRLATMAVPRQRPNVPRLDTLPADASFPSGHVAAAVAVYVGLALLVTARWPGAVVHRVAWSLAVLLPLVVAASRLYRGMHHLSDVVAGVILGCLALLVALTAARAAGAADARRVGS